MFIFVLNWSRDIDSVIYLIFMRGDGPHLIAFVWFIVVRIFIVFGFVKIAENTNISWWK